MISVKLPVVFTTPTRKNNTSSAFGLPSFQFRLFLWNRLLVGRLPRLFTRGLLLLRLYTLAIKAQAKGVNRISIDEFSSNGAYD
ncbi:MAG TPA: hypothetical protein PKW29_14455, partial [Clostridia bacterium]|nr:hypothetical protein [Clostridia bacterium]